MRKISYFMNGFRFQYLIFKEHLNDIFDIDLISPNTTEHTGGMAYIPKNLVLLKKLYKKGDIQKYNIVHFNNTENFLNFKKVPNQISIAESHGFDFGVNYSRFLKDEKNIFKKIVGFVIDKAIGWKIKQKIQEFDIYYCSTPDMIEPLKRIRKDVQWLPNPININIFKPEGETIKLEGNPACFFPTRLHGDKKPEYAIKIFQEYIKPKYPNATLHLLNQGYELPKYKSLLNDSKTYFRHDFMDKQTLAAKIRGSDFCFGDFSIGGLSLMPMQIMACKKPIVTYDTHELIKVERENLFDLTKRIFEDRKFKNEYIERNYQYTIDFHSEKAICKIHLENLKPFMKTKLGLTNKEIDDLIIN